MIVVDADQLISLQIPPPRLLLYILTEGQWNLGVILEKCK